VCLCENILENSYSLWLSENIIRNIISDQNGQDDVIGVAQSVRRRATG
jgi:hypothetical protein